jgi:hypothetical protein
MIRMKSILMVVSCSTLLFAAGSGSNGGQPNGEMGGKTKISGTIQDIMPQDSMLVISQQDQNMLDTVKVTDKTKMDTSLDQLKKGDRVDVDIQTKDNMKVAKRIRMATDGSNGSKEKDTTGNQSDTMPY